MPKPPKVIRRRALRVEQCKGHPLYLFCLTGDEILNLADISRISRDDAGTLLGYQRAEVKRHVQDIVDYLNSDQVLFPNSIILAVSSRIRFISSRGPKVRDGLVVAGTLEIPVPRDKDRKPAWIVDGQQRVLAISKSKRRDLPVPVNAFVADDIEIQRDQFLRVNNTRPLPRGLITELLPEVSTPLPANLEAKKIPSAICELLNSNERSPFYQLIRRASLSSESKKNAMISDTSIITIVQESISSPSGCLFPYRNLATGETDFDGIWKILVAYWTAVKATFPDAWGKPPSKSRLMHGAGLRSMGRLMDRVMSSVDPHSPHALAHVKHELQTIAPVCHWTSGRWSELGDLQWNEIQNVPSSHPNALKLSHPGVRAKQRDDAMKFFFPDSQDFVDDTFDFELETRSEVRVRQRDDHYAHEIFSTPPYNGILVSKAVVDGIGGGSGKYSAAQRQRFLRVGVREYFRLLNKPLATMGDCGAFTYVKEARPPYSPAQVADFYEDCGFDYGLSVDHVILSYRADLDDQLTGIDAVPEAWRSRQNITLELPKNFSITARANSSDLLR